VGNFYGPIGSGAGGGGAVGTGVVSTTLPAGTTANYAGILAATGVAIITANAAGSTLNGMAAGFNGQWVMIVNPAGAGLLTLPSGAGSPANNSFVATGGFSLNLPAGDRTIAVWLTALNAWSIG
jgi:flavin reductase (DIM6/NTAB) family NADH-FMN oxidoreductase RutF